MVCINQLDRINRIWGGFIAQYPKSHIVFSVLLIVAFTIPIRNLHLELDIRRSFSPNDSRAAYENRVYKEFFNLTVSPQRSFVLFSAKDNGSVLRPAHLLDIKRLDQRFSSFLQEIDPLTGLRFCEPLCNLNRPFHMISDHLLNAHANGSQSKDLLIDYPMSSYQGVQMFIGMNFVGMEVADDYSPVNNSKITYAKTIILWYFSRADTPIAKRRLKEISLDLFKLAQKHSYLEHTRFEIFGDEIANAEMVRGAIEATMLMSIGFVLLLIFVSFTVYQKFCRMSRLTVPIIVFTAVLCPFLGCLAAFGLCTALGFPTYSIMCVCPFLVQGVGVDDAFIMLQSWAHHRHITSLRDRMSRVFTHIGPSITITSLTNMLAFGIGFTTPTPQMSLFCLCTSFALFFDYILTFTFLAPIIFLCTPEPSTDAGKEAIQAAATLLPSSNGHAAANAHANGVEKAEMAASNNPLRHVPTYVVGYARFVCAPRGRVVMIVVALLLHSFAFCGIAKMRSTFEPSKAFPSDSPLANSMDSVRAVFNEFFPINIIVNRPPEISNSTDRELFYSMVGELEGLPESYGKDRTLLWLRTYEKFDQETSNLFSLFGFKYYPSYDNVDFFLEQAGNPPTIKTENVNDTTVVKSFQFSIITHNMAEWSNRAVAEEKCREILLRYPNFNATIYDGDSAILDLLLTVKLDLIGSMAVTVVCMTLICSIFIHNQVGIVLVALTISSVCFALVGVLSWLGLDMDPVTMVDVLLATGFSVDFTAHIVHQYYVKSGQPSFVRLALSLHEMCGPMIQAGISTVLCMLPLIFVPTYAIVAFAKTVFVVVGVGLLHGLFLLPVLMCWIPDRYGNCRRQKQRLEIPFEAAALTNGLHEKEAALLHKASNNNLANGVEPDQTAKLLE